MTLDSINQDIGEENQILMDNAPGQTGYKTEMHKGSRLAKMDVCTNETHYLWKNRAGSEIISPRKNPKDDELREI